MNSPLTFTTHLARQAGQLLLEYFQRTGLKTDLKADRSVVTEADLAADRLIAQAIQEQYPGEMILSEELRTSYSAGETTASQCVWIVDPLDGTTNFSLGLHFWGVLVARLVAGQPETAVLYFPLVDELYTAQRGQGAFLNGTRLHVQPPDPARPHSFFACCSRTFRRYNVSIPYKTRILGSAAYTLCCVARGVAVLGFESTAKIWDIAGPWLLVSEAGGVIETLDGSQPFPLQPDRPYDHQNFPTLAAATPEVAAQARQQIQPK